MAYERGQFLTNKLQIFDHHPSLVGMVQAYLMLLSHSILVIFNIFSYSLFVRRIVVEMRHNIPETISQLSAQRQGRTRQTPPPPPPLGCRNVSRRSPRQLLCKKFRKSAKDVNLLPAKVPTRIDNPLSVSLIT
jgi:hypothetical protein